MGNPITWIQQQVYKLVIANRNYSSWSLRAWLYCTESRLSFETIRIPLFTETWAEEIARYSPARRAPVLMDDDFAVWDSTAIIEHLLERHPEAVGWPESARERAHARSISAEIHSGFLALRDELPQNIRARCEPDPGRLSEACRNQVARIDEIWTDCRSKHGAAGPWLFGKISIADIMFAPVALRFVTYSIPVSRRAQEFIDAVCALKSVQEWSGLAQEESEALTFIDELIPASSSPLTLG